MLVVDVVDVLSEPADEMSAVPLDTASVGLNLTPPLLLLLLLKSSLSVEATAG